MSVKYIPVQWNNYKWSYDATMLAAVVLFLYVFLYASPSFLGYDRAINPQVHNARAFGACAVTMLTAILCIGALARLDERFLPLLYNRRHFGEMTVFFALTHASYIVNWSFAFSSSDKYEALFFANTSYGQLAGFPFEIFGVFALTVLAIPAVMSHDFWMKVLSPPVWKRIHYLIYPAYLSVVAHVAFGILQDQQAHAFTVLFMLGTATVGALHLLAAVKERRRDKALSSQGVDWVDVAKTHDFTDGYAKIKWLPTGERVAVYLMEGRLSVISHACTRAVGRRQDR